MKCSFGTSKYCANYLDEGFCHKNNKGTCTFIHRLERNRGKVVESDAEFAWFLSKSAKEVDRYLGSMPRVAVQPRNLADFPEPTVLVQNRPMINTDAISFVESNN